MPEILLPLIQLPTGIFTALLVPICAYWLFVIMGIVDIEFLDALSGADGALEGSVEGAAEALDGVLDGAAEALDGAAEAFDGVAEAFDGVAETAEGAMEAVQGGLMVGLMQALNLRSAPISVVGSFLVLYCWTFSLLGRDLLSGMLGGVLLAVVLGIGSFALGLVLTSITIRPLAPLFESHVGPSRSDYIGSTCTLYTGRVDHNFGQATCEDGGSGLQLQVRCDHENALKRGDEALIVSFDRKREAYIIEPMEG